MEILQRSLTPKEKADTQEYAKYAHGCEERGESPLIPTAYFAEKAKAKRAAAAAVKPLDLSK